MNRKCFKCGKELKDNEVHVIVNEHMPNEFCKLYISETGIKEDDFISKMPKQIKHELWASVNLCQAQALSTENGNMEYWVNRFAAIVLQGQQETAKDIFRATKAFDSELFNQPNVYLFILKYLDKILPDLKLSLIYIDFEEEEIKKLKKKFLHLKEKDESDRYKW